MIQIKDWNNQLLAAVLTGIILAGCAHSPHPINTDITAAELNNHVAYLASDDLAGRKPGTDGDR